MIGRVRDAIRSSRPRRKPGSWHWRVERPRSWVIPTNCGPPGCSPHMPGNTDRLPGIRAWASWPKGQCARSWLSKKSSRTRCAITWNSAIPSSSPRWPRSFVSTGKWRYCGRKGRRAEVKTAVASPSSLMTRNPASRPSVRPRRIAHHCPAVMRDHEYKRHGTLTLMAGIDLLTGHVHALVKERHRSREFIEFLTLLDAAYPADTAIELILDNHSAHVSCETTGWLAAQPIGRFTFTFTPTHGSWLNIIEGFFSKLARSVLRQIRVRSKDELAQRLKAFVNDINREPVSTLGATKSMMRLDHHGYVISETQY